MCVVGIEEIPKLPTAIRGPVADLAKVPYLSGGMIRHKAQRNRKDDWYRMIFKNYGFLLSQ